MELLAQLTFSEKVKNDMNSSNEIQPILYVLATFHLNSRGLFQMYFSE